MMNLSGIGTEENTIIPATSIMPGVISGDESPIKKILISAAIVGVVIIVVNSLLNSADDEDERENPKPYKKDKNKKFSMLKKAKELGKYKGYELGYDDGRDSYVAERDGAIIWGNNLGTISDMIRKIDFVVDNKIEKENPKEKGEYNIFDLIDKARKNKKRKRK